MGSGNPSEKDLKDWISRQGTCKFESELYGMAQLLESAEADLTCPSREEAGCSMVEQSR